MRKRKLGKTGLEVSELGLGTWGLSGDGYGPVSEEDIEATLDRAVEVGITLFDTADVYGAGRMQKLLGKRLPESGSTVVHRIGTDVAGYGQKNFDPTHLRTSLDVCEERLKRRTLDVVLLHNPSLRALENDGIYALFEKFKNEGRLRAWGVSAGSVAVADAALDRGADVLMMPFNCFFFRDVFAITKKLREKGAGLLGRSVLAHGLLAGHWTAEREFYPPDHRGDRWNPDELKRRIEQLGALKSVLGGSLKTIRSVAVRFVLENPDIASAVLGPRRAGQLDQLVLEAGRTPPYLAKDLLTRFHRSLAAYGVTGE